MTFPSSPTNGQTTIVNNIRYTYNSSNNSWKRLGPDTNTSYIITHTVSSTQPTGARVGDIWYNSGEDIKYQYTFDGTNYFWWDTDTSSYNVVDQYNVVDVTSRDTSNNAYAQANTALTLAGNAYNKANTPSINNARTTINAMIFGG